MSDGACSCQASTSVLTESRVFLESQVGLNFLCDHSGKLHTKKPSLKDVRCNGDAVQLHQNGSCKDCALAESAQAVFAVIKATRGDGRLSAYVLRDAILDFYVTNDLFPPGLCAEAECVQTWGLKFGASLRRLVPCLC